MSFQSSYTRPCRDYRSAAVVQGLRRDDVVVMASACARAQRTGGVSSTERQRAGSGARLFRTMYVSAHRNVPPD